MVLAQDRQPGDGHRRRCSSAAPRERPRRRSAAVVDELLQKQDEADIILMQRAAAAPGSWSPPAGAARDYEQSSRTGENHSNKAYTGEMANACRGPVRLQNGVTRADLSKWRVAPLVAQAGWPSWVWAMRNVTAAGRRSR